MAARFYVISSYNKVKANANAPHDGIHYNFQYDRMNLDFKTDDLYVSVVRASIPKTWYLVNTGLNTLTMTEPAHAPVLITIPPGNYNAVSFVSALGPLLTAASTSGVTYTAAFNNQTGKITLTSAPATATSFTFAEAKAEGVHDQWGQLAGSTVTMAAGSLVSSVVCSFVAQDTVCIKSDIVNAPDNILQDLNGATIPFGASITWESPDVRMNAKRLVDKGGNHTFYLQDVDQHYLNTNGRPWSLTLCIFRDPNMIHLSALRVLGPKLDKFLDNENTKADEKALTRK